ncbi:hypothetical protein KBI23_02130 [bacterium]|jgi:hypothetical protein|nr:hypothetical protein [bacterium]MBP9808828.1 hypothetical protein [bacterium]
MNTTVQITPAPAKTTSPRRSRFPGKESGSVSFNLTALGRQLLKEQAASASVSNGDYVEMLIRERAGLAPLRLPPQAKQTGPKGGAKSFFFGKNRGTTTAVCVTPMAHRLLDEQVAASRMSRGDYIEYLLREKAGLIEETFRAYAAQQQAAAAAAAAAPAVAQAVQAPATQVNFAPPAIQQIQQIQPVQPVQQPVVEVTYAQPVITPVTDWNSGS